MQPDQARKKNGPWVETFTPVEKIPKAEEIRNEVWAVWQKVASHINKENWHKLLYEGSMVTEEGC